MSNVIPFPKSPKPKEEKLDIDKLLNQARMRRIQRRLERVNRLFKELKESVNVPE